jgi:hypothetical protein
MTPLSVPLYAENPILPEWSIVNFSFDSDGFELDEDFIDDDNRESLPSIREILEDNDAELHHKICTRCKK